MKTVIWGNYKGGVGKTTSVFQVATYFAQNDNKVLLIDLDPQCSLSNICCNSNGDKILNEFAADETFNYVMELYIRYIKSKKGIDYMLLKDDISTPIKPLLEDICVPLKNRHFKSNLYFIPSSISFENCRINELAQRMSEFIYNIFLIKIFAQDLGNEFDYLFIDCPPTSNMVIQSAFLASDYYIVPTIIDEISAKGVADYIAEIEKTPTRYSMNNEIGGIMVNKVFGEKTKLIGVFETIYKERRGDLDNHDQIVDLDKNISRIPNVKSVVSDEAYKDLRYTKKSEGFTTNNIFKYYIGHRDNRSGGESVPVNTARGKQTPSYDEISSAILEVLED